MSSITHHIQKKIFNITPENFESLALDVFRYQYQHINIYQQFCDAVKRPPEKVQNLLSIPFLPISFFKTKSIISPTAKEQIIFESSGTTGAVNSKHFVADLLVYEESFLHAFNLFYGNPSDYCVIGLLPSYLQRQHSSLVYMVNELIKKSAHHNSGFYLYDHEKLQQVLLENEIAKQPTLFIGVTYALLDFAEQYPMQLKHTIVMETGGMKGRREELTRNEVQQQLIQRLGVNAVHSEYGMTELLSQAYSSGQGIFNCPPWMKILLRADDDPFSLTTANSISKSFAGGAVNIIDLANLHSCSFIATDDIGKLYPNESFEILGRLDNSDTRGCGLMIA